MQSSFHLWLSVGLLLTAVPGSADPRKEAVQQQAAPISAKLVNACQQLASRKIPYVYGGTTDRGMDCSASVQRLFRGLRVNLPRTSESQANTLTQRGQLWRVREDETEQEVFERLRPGELLFWVKESDPNRIGHVMVFLGLNGRTARLWGARGKGKTGLTGSGVDFFEYRLKPRGKSRLAAHGRPF